MTNKYCELIKKLRIEKGLSQKDIYSKLDTSRSTYIAFEQGKTDLNFSQMVKIADIFGISLENIESGMYPNMKKYKEMILSFLRLASSSDKKIPKTKLAKLVYLADFNWFYEKLDSMSGMQYRRQAYGPVPDMYFRALDELESDGKIVIDKRKNNMFLIKESESNTKQQFDDLNSEEKKLIKNISKRWNDKRTEEIVNFTHNQLPYFLCREDEIIPYELITQEDPKNLY
ncbi:MAG: helix-turn-helix domain-containing protein [Patescibacteria group bacterium]|nr:helix-turn-helix domain-containing protein [Patescibacteria group bacterium]